MHIDSIRQENASKTFRALTGGFLDLDKSDISLSYVDLTQKHIIAVTTNYEWHLNYWENNLDTQITQRLLPGIINWSKYDSMHQLTFKKFMPKRACKIDICTKHNTLYELLSVSTDRELDFHEVRMLFMAKPKISATARHVIRKQNINKLTLPLRCTLLPPHHNPSSIYAPKSEIKTCQFGNISITDLEMSTIRQLFSYRSIKEIARTHNCSEKVERKRVSNIKRKMNCEHFPLSFLFDRLNENGVIQSCLDSYIIYQ
ncbi:hypothetical protein [Serratia marcescens]|uniref:hypothetical protein n=1 Tax=Serratia marcescens TaxID=615 RepID=UPI00332565E7